MSDIASFFKLEPVSIQKFFDASSLGYYIPLYQRDYSWDEGNIEQLMADICYGVEALLENEGALHFMGTLILVEGKTDDTDIRRIDERARPQQVRKIIDGQQRISTIALLACLIYRRLQALKQGLPSQPDYVDLASAIDVWQKDIERLYSFDLGRGTPARKPIIVRGEQDAWKMTDGGQSTYRSDVSRYIAEFITAVNSNRADPQFLQNPTNGQVGQNLKTMEQWLDKVANAHDPKPNSDDDYPAAWKILKGISQTNLWSYTRNDLVAVITERSATMTQLERQLSTIVQMLAFCHYFLRRCGFTVIIPATDEGAFDMFQSLNATGTPLTPIETFKPLVVNSAETLSDGYRDSKMEEYYEKVDILFSKETTASGKITRTNEYLTALALIQAGKKLPSQFSAQRMWLQTTFGACKTIGERENYVRHMSELAVYWDEVLRFDPNSLQVLPRTQGGSNANDKKAAALCVLYLKDANHKMANTILARFYARVLQESPHAVEQFIQACKIVAAFFTLWRSALSNRDLDDVYRKLLSNHMSWQKDDANVTVENLRGQLVGALAKKGLGTKREWEIRARQNLTYEDAKTVCKFALFVAAHDTIPDDAQPGLMKIGVSGVDPHLMPEFWRSSDFKSLEHVAPQKRDAGGTWEEAIYVDGAQDRIGNLLLLPTDINSTVGNKRWIEKWLYYQHLALKDPAQQEALGVQAKEYGISLSQKTVKLLQDSGHHSHIRSAVTIGIDGQWDNTLIKTRTERICDILWTRMQSWLQ